MKNYRSIKGRVELLLLKYPHLRDNVEKLVANIWAEDMRKLGVPYNDTLTVLARGELTSFKSIDRAWRQAQKDNEGLRGEKWKLRQRLQEDAKFKLGYKSKTT